MGGEGGGEAEGEGGGGGNREGMEEGEEIERAWRRGEEKGHVGFRRHGRKYREDTGGLGP
jgi:hypothetical protein